LKSYSYYTNVCDTIIESEAGLLPSLDRLAQVFRCLDPDACSDRSAVPSATVKVMEMLWPMLETIIDRYRVCACVFHYHIIVHFTQSIALIGMRVQ
jgi:hypothetical protein